MFALVDAGNTRIKVALANAVGIVESAVFKGFDSEFISFLQRNSVHRIFIEAVVELPPFPPSFDIVLLSSTSILPLKNKYETPQTLGADRLANACGAFALNDFKGPVLSIDMGTCIKFDVVDNEGSYCGGSISPGLNMRLNALHTYTEKLPLVQVKTLPQLVGKNTSQSIASGVVNGIIEEINGLVNRYEIEYPGIKVFLTGGDAAFFAGSLKNNIFATPLLTMQGLYAIARLNGF